MIPTPAQPKKWYGLGAVNYHTGETIVHIRRRKRRIETAELLQALRDRHPSGIVDVAWDNANTHMDDDGEAVVRAAAGWWCCMCPPIVPGSIPLSCFGGISGVK